MPINQVLGCFFTYSKFADIENQDAILPPTIINDRVVMAIADGVGGNVGGAVAAKMAIYLTSKILFKNKNLEMKALFHNIKNEFEKKAEKDPLLKKMGTTLTVVSIYENRMQVCTSGDTRAYIANCKGLTQITEDHSEIQELLNKGIFSEEQLKEYPRKNVLTSAISPSYPLKINEYSYEIQKSDLVLIMSDGAYRSLNSKNIDLTDVFALTKSIKDDVISNFPSDDYSVVSYQHS